MLTKFIDVKGLHHETEKEDNNVQYQKGDVIFLLWPVIVEVVFYDYYKDERTVYVRTNEGIVDKDDLIRFINEGRKI